MLTANGNSYSYDDENRIVWVSLILGGTATYSYDADGRRIRKVAGTATEEYVYDSAGHQFGTMQPNGTMIRMELYAGARHLATYDSATNATYFIHGDWQGTERLRTNSAGASYETCSNLPFGDSQQCSGGTDVSPMHFTGKERDTESGNDYFEARYYASTMGRFLSPDWSAKEEPVPYAKLDDPQSLNLYSYVRNNPLIRIDADGHETQTYDLNGLDRTTQAPVTQTEKNVDMGILFIGASVLSGGALDEAMAAGAALRTATALIATTGNAVAGTTLLVGSAVGADPHELANAASTVSTITTPVGLGTAIGTGGNMDAAGKASDAASGAKLIAHPAEALKNPADAALTVNGVKEIAKGAVDKAKSMLSTPPPPPTPKAPGRPSCSIPGAC